MSEQVASTFIEALRTLEQSRDAEPLAALHGESSVIGTVLSPDRFHGREGARAFWTEYRGMFETVESSFRNIIAADGHIALEWTTRGTSFEGAPLEYSGVSILEIDDGAVARFCAPFDPKALGRQIKEEEPQDRP